MQAGADVLGQQHVAGDDRLLGHGRPAGQPQLRRDEPLVHLGALGQARVLGVLGDHAVEGLHVLQRAPHQHRVVHALAVVAEHADAGAGVRHRVELGEALALEAHGDRADGADGAPAGGLAAHRDLLDHARGVRDGGRVGHGVHGGEAAAGGGAGAGLDGLGLLAAGLAQVGVEVDQTGEDHAALGVDHLDAVRHLELAADRGDPALADQDVLHVLAVGATAAQQQRGRGAGGGGGGVSGHGGPPGRRWRAGGRARPCARTRRRRPARR